MHSLMCVLNCCSGCTAPCGSCSHRGAPCCPSSGPCAAREACQAPTHWQAGQGAAIRCQHSHLARTVEALQQARPGLCRCVGGLFAQPGTASFLKAADREQPASNKG